MAFSHLHAPARLAVCAVLLVGCIFDKSDDDSAPAAPDAGPTLPPPNDASVPPLDFGSLSPSADDAGTGIVINLGDPGPSQGRVIYAVDRKNHLVRFGTASLSTVAVFAITGLVDGDAIVGIDFRPSNGALYALGAKNRVYTLDRTTGAATAIGSTSFMPPAEGQAHGVDFNPVADKLRIHTDVDKNVRVDPTTGAVTAADGALAFADDDPNAGQSPNLAGSAYTNSVTPAPGSTALFAIDSTRDLLVRVPNPNDGKLQTIGPLGVDATDDVGFDIWGSDAQREVYAAMRVDNVTGLYTVDLSTGAATLLGPIAYPLPLAGIAVLP